MIYMHRLIKLYLDFLVKQFANLHINITLIKRRLLPTNPSLNAKPAHLIDFFFFFSPQVSSTEKYGTCSALRKGRRPNKARDFHRQGKPQLAVQLPTDACQDIPAPELHPVYSYNYGTALLFQKHCIFSFTEMCTYIELHTIDI